jgi:hypothetical protein
VNSSDGVYSDVQLMPYLFCFQSSCYRSRYLTCHHFGFNIPANASIDGILLTVNGKSSMMGSVMDCTIVLMKNYVPAGLNHASGNDWDTAATLRLYGSPIDSWGLAWTPQEVNDLFFGAYVKVYNPTSSSPAALIDAVAITVFYSIGTAAYSQTSSPGEFHAVNDPYLEQIAWNYFSGERTGTVEVKLVDCFGRICYKRGSTPNSSSLSETIATTSLAPGIYFCTLSAGDNSYTQKIVITK